MASSPLVHHHHHHFQQRHSQVQVHHLQCKQLFEQDSLAPLNNSTSSLTNSCLLKENKFNKANRLNTGTPKRRLSYNNSHSTNSTPTLIGSSSISMSLSQIPMGIQNENNSPISLSTFNLNSDAHLIDSAPSSTNTTPFIKRKCLNKEDSSIQFTQTAYRKNSLNSNVGNNSPYLISSINLTSEANLNEISHSPKQHLNDSFETLHMMDTNEKSCSSSTSSSISTKSGRNHRYLPRRLSNPGSKLFSKHKSAPLSNISYSLMMNSQQMDSSKCASICENQSHPLNDISNHINSKHLILSNANSIASKMNEDISFSDEQRDDVTDLENLIYGHENVGNKINSGNSIMNELCSFNNNNNSEQQSLIKQSLEIDATHKNLIGDRTKQHILPIIQSNKHQDLHCISPETLVDVLNGNYCDQINECIIIDSRYPYEYDGGHISTALNIFTKEKLYEEMFIKRLNFKNSSIHKFTSSYSTNCLTKYNNASDCMETNTDSDAPNENQKKFQLNITKRSIVIFHCEFSSERGPSLLRFLRNQDRSLNEHDYPNLYYPELYLLEGGYKLFYESFKNYCQPQMYKPMLHAEHYEDLKHFRAKAKSWEVSRHHIINRNENLQKKIILCHTKSEQAKLIEQQEPAHKVKSSRKL